MKKRATRRAIETKDALRLIEDGIPLIQDSNEHITPAIAEEMLKRNENNRVINWNAVNKIVKQMKAGEWEFHAQGIILDGKNNILTGQKRLWAVVLGGIPHWFRVSRGSPSHTGRLIDRGIPQTSRDLASRGTKRKHSPIEDKMAKEILAIRRVVSPTLDEVANIMASYSNEFSVAMLSTKGTKKIKAVIMVMAALCYINNDDEINESAFVMVPELAKELEQKVYPILIKDCWRRPAAHFMVMETAVGLCQRS